METLEKRIQITGQSVSETKLSSIVVPPQYTHTIGLLRVETGPGL